jgi:hypothetical protein
MDPGPNLANLSLMSVWQWVEQARPSNLADLRREAILGRNWLLMPPRKVVLVHAVQRPVTAPTLTSVIADRPHVDASFADVTVSAEVHQASTSKVDVQAAWSDLVDDLSLPEPREAPRHAHLGVIAILEGLDPGASVSFRQEFGDTRRHRVTYRSIGTTSFGEYFLRHAEVVLSGTAAIVLEAGGIAPSSEVVKSQDGTTTFTRFDGTTGDYVMDYGAGSIARSSTSAIPDGATAQVDFLPPVSRPGQNEVTRDVKSSARPAAPSVRYIVPTFGWTRSTAPEGDLVFESIREGRGVRVFLERPWLSSGEGELLGVVFVNGQAVSPTDPRTVLVSAWGSDPLWSGPKGDGLFTEATFPGAVVEHDLTLAELPPDLAGRFRVSVAGFAPEYDKAERRRVWVCDVALDLKDENGFSSLRQPFVRLALARFQPESVVEGDRDVKLSRVVLTDFVQLTPTRRLEVRALRPQAPGMLSRGVTVFGDHSRRFNGGVPRRMAVSVLKRRWKGDDLGWQPEANATTKLEERVGFWEGTVSFPADGAERRLLLKELETLLPDLIVAGVRPDEMRRGATRHKLVVGGQGFLKDLSLILPGVQVHSQEIKRVAGPVTEIEMEVSIDAEETPGPRDVTVANPDGRTATCPACFTIQLDPRVDSADPLEAFENFTPVPATVTIHGKDLASGAEVRFSPSEGIKQQEGSPAQANTQGTTLTVPVEVMFDRTRTHEITVVNPDGSGAFRTNVLTITTKEIVG